MKILHLLEESVDTLKEIVKHQVGVIELIIPFRY